MTVNLTPSQTIGPYFAVGLPWDRGPFVVPEGTPGGVWIRGRLLDGAGEPVSDALVESWQVDGSGRTPRVGDPGFRGFGRAATDERGTWEIFTVKPGPTANAIGVPQAPHLDLLVFARGLLKPVTTRIYFVDEEAANAADPLQKSIGSRASSLRAVATQEGYAIDIHLQGERETVFFDG